MVGALAKFLKPYIEDTSTSKPVPLFYHQRTAVEEQGDEHDFIVESILDHKIEKGEIKFKTKWAGYGEEEATWEKAKNFLWGVNSPWREYCAQRGLKIDLVSDIG